MKIRTTVCAAAATIAIGGATMVVAPAANALSPTRGDGRLVERCTGRVVQSGPLRAPDGSTHPTARWKLYSSGKNGGTVCFQVFANAPGPHAIAGDILKPSNGSGAYSDIATASGKSPGLLMEQARHKCVTFEGRIRNRRGPNPLSTGPGASSVAADLTHLAARRTRTGGRRVCQASMTRSVSGREQQGRKPPRWISRGRMPP